MVKILIIIFWILRQAGAFPYCEIESQTHFKWIIVKNKMLSSCFLESTSTFTGQSYMSLCSNFLNIDTTGKFCKKFDISRLSPEEIERLKKSVFVRRSTAEGRILIWKGNEVVSLKSDSPDEIRIVLRSRTKDKKCVHNIRISSLDSKNEIFKKNSYKFVSEVGELGQDKCVYSHEITIKKDDKEESPIIEVDGVYFKSHEYGFYVLCWGVAFILFFRQKIDDKIDFFFHSRSLLIGIFITGFLLDNLITFLRLKIPLTNGILIIYAPNFFGIAFGFSIKKEKVFNIFFGNFYFIFKRNFLCPCFR